MQYLCISESGYLYFCICALSTIFDILEPTICRTKNIRGLIFQGPNLPRPDLPGPNLSGAQFAGAQFARARFAGAQITGAQFAGENARGPICLKPAEWLWKP